MLQKIANLLDTDVENLKDILFTISWGVPTMVALMYLREFV